MHNIKTVTLRSRFQSVQRVHFKAFSVQFKLNTKQCERIRLVPLSCISELKLCPFNATFFSCHGTTLTVRPASNIKSHRNGVFSFACNLDLFVMFEVPIHLMFVIHVKGTCRTCIVIEAQAWIKLSTMPVSKNTRYFSINIWLIFLRHFF